MNDNKGLKPFSNNLHSQYFCKLHKESKGKESKIASNYFTLLHMKSKRNRADGNQKHIFDPYSYSFITVVY